MFANVPFPNPPNYAPENDPYADNWGRLNEKQREMLEQWRRNYYAMTANLDWNLGRFFQAIDDAGIRDNTLVVFTSDHGEMFGAHGRRAKNIFYEEASRIPYLMRMPGTIPAGTVSDACLSTVDIMPTVLSLLGLPIPEAVEGMDLSGVAKGEAAPEPRAALLENTGACAAWQNGYEWRGVRDKRFTYATYRVDQSELLFDNVEDPLQMHNLAQDPTHTETVKELRAFMHDKMGSLNDTFETCTWYRDHWTEDRIILRAAKG